jgi:hypothetical protein
MADLKNHLALKAMKTFRAYQSTTNSTPITP